MGRLSAALALLAGKTEVDVEGFDSTVEDFPSSLLLLLLLLLSLPLPPLLLLLLLLSRVLRRRWCCSSADSLEEANWNIYLKIKKEESQWNTSNSIFTSWVS
jgi:hypothetical protein